MRKRALVALVCGLLVFFGASPTWSSGPGMMPIRPCLSQAIVDSLLAQEAKNIDAAQRDMQMVINDLEGGEGPHFKGGKGPQPCAKPPEGPAMPLLNPNDPRTEASKIAALALDLALQSRTKTDLEVIKHSARTLTFLLLAVQAEITRY